MLVLSRRLNEKILLPSLHISVQVLEVRPGVVRLGVDAPPEVTILRQEVPDRVAEWGLPDDAPDPTAAPDRFLRERLADSSRGLGMARLQLRMGLGAEAADTLERLHRELQTLRRRLEGPTTRAETPAEEAPPVADQLAACVG